MADLPHVRGIEKTTPGFRAALVRMARKLGLSADAIAAVMALESGFNPQAVNPNGGATGLIQFMPATAVNLGTTAAALRGMTAIEQLLYVERYFQGNPRLKAGSRAGDYYMATFMPGFMGLPDATPIAFRGDKIYSVNKGLDQNADGIITVGDVRGVLESELARASSKPRIQVDENAAPEVQTAGVGDDGALVLVGGAALFLAGAWWFGGKGRR